MAALWLPPGRATGDMLGSNLLFWQVTLGHVPARFRLLNLLRCYFGFHSARPFSTGQARTQAIVLDR